MKNFRAAFIPTLALLLAGGSAQAFVVDLDGTNATGIRDLDIGGTAYDVVFDFASAATAPVACGAAMPCDVFFGDETAADAAVAAINLALNNAINVNVPAQSVGSTQKIDFFVPFASGGGNTDAAQGTFAADTTWIGIGAALDDPDTIEYARFSPAVIPIPPAALLFGSALGILGWVRRRTSQVSPA
jgi:hypothetical protein